MRMMSEGILRERDLCETVTVICIRSASEVRWEMGTTVSRPAIPRDPINSRLVPVRMESAGDR